MLHLFDDAELCYISEPSYCSPTIEIRPICHQKCLRTAGDSGEHQESKTQVHLTTVRKKDWGGWWEDWIGFWICLQTLYLYWGIWKWSILQYILSEMILFRLVHIQGCKTRIPKSICLENEYDFIIKTKGKIPLEMYSWKKADALFKSINNP